ncbi:MAG TPA: substrate-binding domain-containing protein [Burkholderiales bacterium]|nr:substrate-binding domain-containing protein [Burkholderiales bacterium]
MIKVNLQYLWQPQPGKDFAVDATLFRVLFAVHETGSLAAAARAVDMSYRHVWGLMGKWEKIFGKPLVVLRQGRGARLSEFGQKLLWAEELVRARMTPGLESVRQEIEQVLSQAMEASPKRLSLCASHDLALAALRDLLAHREGLKLDVRFKGSLESLDGFARGRCALAGFHIAEGMEKSAAATFSRHLDARRHRLIGMATRTQGLMVRRGNPKKIQSLADLAHPGVRIVNRQQGSGSRIEFDELLAGAGIDPGAIDGYLNEEYTHLAVAATVAGGKVDAGFGIKAAAAQYELDYLPLLTERYYLACRADAMARPEIAQFVQVLRSEEFKGILSELPGYGNAITGEVFDVESALRPARLPAQTAKP